MISVKDIYETKDRPKDDLIDVLQLWAEENDLYFVDDVFLDNDNYDSHVDAAVFERQTDRMEEGAPSAWVVDGEMWVYTHDGTFQGQKIDPKEIFLVGTR